MIQEGNFLIAFGLSLFAGLSTVLGAIIVYGLKSRTPKILSLGLGFSAGVMLYLSFFELIPEARQALFSQSAGGWLSLVFYFFAGLAVAAIIDFFTHNFVHKKTDCPVPGKKPRKGKHPLHQLGVFTALAIAIHNFPEGIATFASAATNLSLGIPLALAVAIHNIPEGMCVALPVYCATGSKSKGIVYTLWAGLAEPLGAVLAYFFLFPFFTAYIEGALLAVVAGIMIYVALDELLPAARENGQLGRALTGLVLGAVSMYLILPLIK